jgi:hypothetical protein
MIFPPHHGSIASLTPTVCHLLGVKPPHISAEPPLDMLIASLAKDKFQLQKCLIVAPDAIGAHLWWSHERELRQVLPLSPAWIQALGQHIQDFKQLAGAANRRWKDKRHVIVFAPDHGAHIDPSSRKDDHGLDIPEDMDLFHC